MQLNMGPHHPATHGVINFLLETDGEIMRRARPDVGYLHRGLEKLAEQTPYAGTMPYTDRIDYLGSMFTNHGWALAVEKLAGVEVPRRAEFCRVIASELNRIASHLIATGALAMDLGAFTPFIHWLRERETINDFMERICGARLTYNYLRVGGVARDIDADTIAQVGRWLDHFEPIIDEFDRLISGNEIFVQRLRNITIVSPADAVAWGLVGPNLRASGVDWDIRRDEAAHCRRPTADGSRERGPQPPGGAGPPRCRPDAPVDHRVCVHEGGPAGGPPRAGRRAGGGAAGRDAARAPGRRRGAHVAAAAPAALSARARTPSAPCRLASRGGLRREDLFEGRGGEDALGPAVERRAGGALDLRDDVGGSYRSSSTTAVSAGRRRPASLARATTGRGR
jgi:hypothetical protein